MLIEAPNVLLLDEPTNDLDVHTLTVLEDFLEDFRGCVVVVSHDRYFLDRSVDRLFAFEGGRLQRFEGNYSAYLERRAGEAKAAAVPVTPAAVIPAAVEPAAQNSETLGGGAPRRPRRRSYKETRELEQLDAHLPAWEQQRLALEAQLLGAGTGDYTDLERLTQELSTLVERIHQGEERWMELSELPA